MQRQEIVLAGGCFWGVERYVKLIPGILDTEVGYANGLLPTVTYEAVKTGTTGHAEAVRVAFDADRMPLSSLLTLFFDAIDPVSVDRQGGDAGHQYRTGVYYPDPSQLPEIEKAMAALRARTPGTVAVEVLPLSQYCAAEAYHQDYLDKNPDGYCHITLAQLMRLSAKAREHQYS